MGPGRGPRRAAPGAPGHHCTLRRRPLTAERAPAILARVGGSVGLVAFSGLGAWSRPFFGRPALLLRARDYWVVGGPLEVAPRRWRWLAYSGPTEHGRAVARAWAQLAPEAGYERRFGRDWWHLHVGAATCLIGHDAAGPYVAAMAAELPPERSPEELQRELVTAAEWLRRERDAAAHGEG